MTVFQHPNPASSLKRGESKLTKRLNKTTRDHQSGSWNRCIQNRFERVAWQQDTSNNKVFPKHTCNGKKNRNASCDAI